MEENIQEQQKTEETSKPAKKGVKRTIAFVIVSALLVGAGFYIANVWRFNCSKS